MNEIARLNQRIAELEGALEFYADPDTYFAIGFFPNRPCGEFIDDFDDVHNPGYPKPGKRARSVLLNAEGRPND
jgi:hypothetical protein